jgi:hypothetical protein
MATSAPGTAPGDTGTEPAPASSHDRLAEAPTLLSGSEPVELEVTPEGPSRPTVAGPWSWPVPGEAVTQDRSRRRRTIRRRDRKGVR